MSCNCKYLGKSTNVYRNLSDTHLPSMQFALLTALAGLIFFLEAVITTHRDPIAFFCAMLQSSKALYKF